MPPSTIYEIRSGCLLSQSAHPVADAVGDPVADAVGRVERGDQASGGDLRGQLGQVRVRLRHELLLQQRRGAVRLS
eukprot:872296-Prorocentrum_minimum.AAC.1